MNIGNLEVKNFEYILACKGLSGHFKTGGHDCGYDAQVVLFSFFT